MFFGHSKLNAAKSAVTQAEPSRNTNQSARAPSRLPRSQLAANPSALLPFTFYLLPFSF
jgi:hypothetical protein